MTVKEYLKTNNMTCKQLALLVGVTTGTIQRYKTGLRRCRNEAIMARIVDVTNGKVTPNDFYGVQK